MSLKKPESLFYAHAQNALLRILTAEVPIDNQLPTQENLATRIGASRTTIHRIIKAAKASGLLKVRDGSLVLNRRILKKDYLDEPAAFSRRELVEQSIMDMLASGRLRPGDRFSELALAREHDVTTVTIREALSRVARLGVFSKSARKQWTVVAMDAPMINELMDLRILIETFALGQFFRDPALLRDGFLRIRDKMQQYATTAGARPLAFPEEFLEMDREFHRLILESGRNRYLIDELQFVYFPMESQFMHYREWESKRWMITHSQHMGILGAIVAGDKAAAMTQLNGHLEYCRETWLEQ
jgi:DNA-binding GntR family transcriptional regulator